MSVSVSLNVSLHLSPPLTPRQRKRQMKRDGGETPPSFSPPPPVMSQMSFIADDYFLVNVAVWDHSLELNVIGVVTLC